jgi:hypothetical protein
MAILINDNSARVQYTATAGQTVFTVPFEFFENGNLVVYNGSTVLTYAGSPANASQYSATGAGVTGGGSITLGSPGASLGDIITIVRDLPIERTSDFPLSGPFNIDGLNTTLDKMTAMLQGLQTSLEQRVPRLADSDAPDSLNSLPVRSSRTNKVFYWDSAGQPSALDPSALGGSIAFGSVVVDSFTGNGSTTTFTLSENPVSINNLIVTVNGVTKTPTTDYTISGATTLLFASAPANGATILVRFARALSYNLYETGEGSGLIGYGSDRAYDDGTVGNELVPRVTLAILPAVGPKLRKVAFVQDSGRQGHFICRAGTAPSDPQQGIYVPSSTSGFYWERIWDGVHGQPEWFGAETGNSAFDNRTALGACLALCPVVLLGSKDYWISGTWKANTPYRTIRGGTYGDGYNTGTGTRVLSTDASANVFQLGPDSAPGSMSSYLRNVVVENVTFGHGVTLTAPGVGSEGNAVKAVRVQYVLNCRIDRVSAWEPFIGFSFYGAVRTIVKDWKVLRTMAHSGTGDFCRAIWCVGSPAIAAGGNPSLFLTDGAFECSPSLSITKQAVYADGEFADLFIDGLETSAATNAVAINGSGSGNYGRIDLHIRNIIADQCAGAAIDVQGLNAQALVTISGGYVQAKSSATAVVWLRGGAGRISVGGGLQIVCAEAGSTIGLYVNGQPNVTVDETVSILDCPTPFTVDGTSPGGEFRGFINNPIVGDNTKYAVSLSGQTRWKLCPSIDGKNNAFAQAVFLIGSSNTDVSIDPTNVKAAVTSGNRLLLNSTAITAPGYYTSSGGSGTSGQGIHVTGITA